MIRRAFFLMFAALAFGLSAPLFAQDAPPPVISEISQISEAEIESRARDIGHALRCVVCQNQSIEESDASLAEDMRRLVRARIRAGETDEQIMTFMQNRYGDFVLLKPPVQKNTYILWGSPFLLIIAGLIWFGLQTRKTRAVATQPPLSPEEQEALEALTRPSPPPNDTNNAP